MKAEKEKIYSIGIMDSGVMGLPAYISKSEDIVSDLGLSEMDFKKYTLDIGAGDSFFAMYLDERNGITNQNESNVISLDYDANSYYQMHKQNVEADVENLPFDDNHFEQIISYQGFPFLFFSGFLSNEEKEGKKDLKYSSKWMEQMDKTKVVEKMENSFREIVRVLQVGGKFLAFPIYDIEGNEVLNIFNKHLKNILEKLKLENIIDYKFVKVADGQDKNGNHVDFNRLEITKIK
jgi:SAM-dependent methyltransferase